MVFLPVILMGAYHCTQCRCAMLLDQMVLAVIPEWEYRYVSLVLNIFSLLSLVSAHLVFHYHHHLLTLPPPQAGYQR
jgi:hypothetical protein